MLPLSPALAMSTIASTPDTSSLHPELAAFAQARMAEASVIPEDRKAVLTELANWIRSRLDAGATAPLVFICTHNSRRSHMAELWARTAAEVFGVFGVSTHSGGTEATAFDGRAVAALKRAGFEITRETEGDNPRHRVRLGPDAQPAEAFSKVYSAPPNPREGFAAVMTCGQADQGCPIVLGAAHRVSVPYEDPKAFDGSPREAEVYDERVAQIGREILYLFSRIP